MSVNEFEHFLIKVTPTAAQRRQPFVISSINDIYYVLVTIIGSYPCILGVTVYRQTRHLIINCLDLSVLDQCLVQNIFPFLIRLEIMEVQLNNDKRTRQII